MKTGKVILVGAGPGDPGLLTQKGRRAIEQADVVVYDRLVSQAILDLIPDTAERINVGKEASHHPVPQERINQILLEQAQAGRQVVRLKGGDPFMFGRGGEELELLAEQGVPFEEVPGITSAIAVPAYAGIPVTHRDYCSSLHIITGHQRAGKALDIRFEALVQTGGTLVFLMGVTALAHICEGLLQAGMDPSMPAAVVEKGTTPAQRPLLATVSTLPAAAEQAQVQSPAIIIVGKVCTLSEQFDWFDHLPLKGRTVVVTRPKDRAGTLCDRLRAVGADVIEFPCIETEPLRPCPAMAEAVENIGQYTWLAFTSPAGVHTLMEWLFETGRDVRALGAIHLAAIGPGTDKALRQYGLHADVIPAVYDGEHLGQALAQAATGGKVLLLRAEWGTEAITDALQNGGVAYDDIRCYETRYTCPRADEVRARLEEETEHPVLVTFTSASTVRGFVASMGDIPREKMTAVCIGRQTEAEAAAHGFTTVTAEKATLDALVDCLLTEAAR